MSEPVLARARSGDQEALRDLLDPYQPELLLHCYRILGSVQDAEDVLQETLVAAWRGLAGFEERSSVRAWLYRIATNRCLNALRDAKRRPVTVPIAPFQPPDPTAHGEVGWLQPYPDRWLDQLPDAAPGPSARYEAREAVELAFIEGLQRLPARQRAVLVLRDVLGFATDEAASILDTSTASVKAALQRARAALPRERAAQPGGSGRPGDQTARLDSAEERSLARRFADAFAADDVDGVVALLTGDARLTMPPAPHEYVGPEAIASFLRASAAWRGTRRFRLVPTQANSQPAFACYLPEDTGGEATAAGLIVLTIGDGRLRAITRFLDNGVFALFDLPERVPAAD